MTLEAQNAADFARSQTSHEAQNNFGVEDPELPKCLLILIFGDIFGAVFFRCFEKKWTEDTESCRASQLFQGKGASSPVPPSLRRLMFLP